MVNDLGGSETLSAGQQQLVRDPDTGQGRLARNVAAANGRPDAVPGPKSSVTMGGTSGAQTAGRRAAPVRPRKCFTIAANGERVWRSGPRRLLASQDEGADLLMLAPPPSNGHKIPWAPAINSGGLCDDEGLPRSIGGPRSDTVRDL
jgi:hypothetical protein